MASLPDLKAWHECDICEFQGPMTFIHQSGEDYSQTDEPVMLDVTCPSCGLQENVLMTWDHYQEILAENRALEMQGG